MSEAYGGVMFGKKLLSALISADVIPLCRQQPRQRFKHGAGIIHDKSYDPAQVSFTASGERSFRSDRRSSAAACR